VKQTLLVFIDPDTFEILVDGNTIVRVIKHMSDGYISRQVRFTELSEQTQLKIVERINER
jgi:hypothetical protein